MSKAFTKEDTDFEDDGEPTVVAPALQGKNYMTPRGLRALQDELRTLVNDERPKVCETVAWAASNGDRSENADYQYGKRRLREIDRRVRYLTQRLDAAEMIDPLLVKVTDQVLFSATVTIRDEEDREKTYSIVGVDEIDVAKGKISWLSPLGAALLKSHIGDFVQFRSPKGVQEIEIVSVCYKEIF